MPWRRERQPISVFLPGESHRQKSLAGYSLWGRKESDTTELLILVLSEPAKWQSEDVNLRGLSKSGAHAESPDEEPVLSG